MADPSPLPSPEERARRRSLVEQAVKADRERGDLMHRYRLAEVAEYRLEEAVVQAFGGLESCWFEDWYFDTYDSSVELVGSEVGHEPDDKALAAMHAAGIRSVFVSYKDGTAQVWFWREGAWKHGPCSPRAAKRDSRAMVRSLSKALASERQAAEKLAEALACQVLRHGDKDAEAALSTWERAREVR